MTEARVRIQRSMQGCKVLIVEDDIHLAGEIVDLLTPLTECTPIVSHSMEAALRQLESVPEFDLVILDVMLPRSESEFDKILSIEERVREFRKEISLLERRERDPEAIERLKGIRYERAIALKTIDDLIDSRGGISLIEEWKRSHLNSNWSFPTVFLTAISRDQERQRGRQAAGDHSEWLVKPVSSETLCEACAGLLLKR
jgi:CheY-like chemotaxis protein